MKRTSLAVLLVLVVGACAGCSRGKDEVLPDGTKLFGVRTLPDGTKHAARVEHPNGKKEFEYTWLPDGTQKSGRRELPNGEINFDVISKNGKITTIGHTEFPNGVKTFETIFLPDGTQKVGRVEFPDGKRIFESTQLPGGKSAIKRIAYPDGQVQTDVTLLADGSIEPTMFEWSGVRDGMSLAEFQAKHGTNCQESPSSNHVGCAANGNLEALFFHGHLYSFRVDCNEDYKDRCGTLLAATKAYFGKPTYNGQKFIDASAGAMRLDVIDFRSSHELAEYVVPRETGAYGNLTVCSHDFSPSSECHDDPIAYPK